MSDINEENEEPTGCEAQLCSYSSQPMCLLPCWCSFRFVKIYKPRKLGQSDWLDVWFVITDVFSRLSLRLEHKCP